MPEITLMPVPMGRWVMMCPCGAVEIRAERPTMGDVHTGEAGKQALPRRLPCLRPRYRALDRSGVDGIDQFRVILSGLVHPGTHRPVGDPLGGQVVDDVADRLAISQERIEPWLEALLVQGQGHAEVDLCRHAAGRLGEDRAAGLAVRPLAPDARQPDRLAILAAQEVRLLLPVHQQPLVPAIRRHQAAVMGERPFEVVGGGHLLDGGVDGLRCLLFRPVRPVAPPHLVHHQRRIIARMAHRGDPSARRHIVARCQFPRPQRQAQGLGELGI